MPTTSPVAAEPGACPPFPGLLTRDQVMALRLLLLHFRAAEPEDARIGDAALYSDNEPLTRDDVRNLLLGRTLLGDRSKAPEVKQRRLYERMHRLLAERWSRLAGHDTLVHLFRAVYGIHAGAQSPAQAFGMDEKWFTWGTQERQQLVRRFAGDYLCFRYALNRSANPLDPDIVVSFLSIHDEPGEDIRYSIVYHPRDAGLGIEDIRGRLAIVDRYVYLIGLNGGTGTPHIMAGFNRPEQPNERGFLTLLFRHTNDSQIVAARVYALPLRALDLSRTAARKLIGFHTSDALEKDFGRPPGTFAELKDRICNVVAFQGRGGLSSR